MATTVKFITSTASQNDTDNKVPTLYSDTCCQTPTALRKSLQDDHARCVLFASVSCWLYPHWLPAEPVMYQPLPSVPPANTVTFTETHCISITANLAIPTYQKIQFN